MTDQVMMYCKQCKAKTLHVQPTTSHVLHLLLSLITFGLWLIIWLIVTANNRNQGQCAVCGRTQGLFGTGTPGNRPAAEATPRAGGRDSEIREERECPHCAERILTRAKICKHCGQPVQAAEPSVFRRRRLQSDHEL